ncbi:MAG TPA: WGxxGxxG family protein [Blastocatellia bacterium]|nr:WGxxGxxG family protein [Blastocatellia bacterium]
MKRIKSPAVLRAITLCVSLTFIPLATPIFAQTNDNANRGAEARRDDDRDRRDRRDRDDDDDDFPWGLLGLAGLAGLLGLRGHRREPEREIYVDKRDLPPTPPRG